MRRNRIVPPIVPTKARIKISSRVVMGETREAVELDHSLTLSKSTTIPVLIAYLLIFMKQRPGRPSRRGRDQDGKVASLGRCLAAGHPVGRPATPRWRTEGRYCVPPWGIGAGIVRLEQRHWEGSPDFVALGGGRGGAVAAGRGPGCGKCLIKPCDNLHKLS